MKFILSCAMAMGIVCAVVTAPTASAHAVIGISVGFPPPPLRVEPVVVVRLEWSAPCVGWWLLDLRTARLSLRAGAMGQDWSGVALPRRILEAVSCC